MKKNLGMNEKVVRIILALFFVTLSLTHVVTGIWSIVLLVLAGVLLVTSVFSFCPLWAAFGISSRKTKAV